MKIGKVTGSVWSTKKAPALTGQILQTVQCGGQCLVAADLVGAGVGDWVLLCFGSSARIAADNVPVDAAIVGILDQEVPNGRQ
ncbi:MAG: carbon dioxide concentrating mechanism protein CcmL [Ruminococcaceae bacterium]|nr:carbon dioxide concentrating mechanism protein CcmL [Oscillospiraceae bacterium]